MKSLLVQILVVVANIHLCYGPQQGTVYESQCSLCVVGTGGWLLNDKCVIHIPEPYPWRVGGSADGLDFKLFHKQAGNNGADGGTHGCSMYLLKILTFIEEMCVFETALPTMWGCGVWTWMFCCVALSLAHTYI